MGWSSYGAATRAPLWAHRHGNDSFGVAARAVAYRDGVPVGWECPDCLELHAWGGLSDGALADLVMIRHMERTATVNTREAKK